ncbi:MAG: stage III sporulation protein AC [Ruminococcaceae bacterium]|nr:stage III sporulation protein AC [Oscillospiraceae bacterium]
MNISLVLKVAGIGLIVSVAHQILSKSGRDEQAALVTVAGLVIAMLMLTQEIAALLQSIKNAFGI